MTKDWEYHRALFIADRHDNLAKQLEIADKDIESPIEKIAYMQIVYIRNFYGILNLQLRRQAEIDKYRVDFLLIYLEKTKIVIECDGHDFHEKTKQQVSRDKARDRELQKSGYIVLRYSGSDIVNDPYNIALDIQELLGTPEWIRPKAEQKEG